jgi:site-specific DNA-methyltransferase (adenine-specific)
MRRANEACEVKDAAVRKYLDQGHLWYFPPPETFEKLQQYANAHGRAEGKPYFSIDGRSPATASEWAKMRTKFHCPHGFTNVWKRMPVSGRERLKAPRGKAIHLNQKPLDLMRMTIEASSDTGDVVWEPFGGLFTACLAAKQTARRGFGCEIDPTYFQYGVSRFTHHPIPKNPTAETTARVRRQSKDRPNLLLF